MSLAKLAAGPLRRGRGNTGDETRQLQDESVERDELLRAGVNELCENVAALGTSGTAGSTVHREAFGFDSSTVSAEVYAAFTSSVVERNVSGAPRANNVWRAPFAGTITGVFLVHESDTGAGGVTAQWYETDGSTTVGDPVTALDTNFTLGAGTGYQNTLVMSVDVTQGQLLTLGLDGGSAIGECNCWLELTPA